ncbi:MAG TPA: decaprenyl-phosphate phosphoribosyltransferase [Thermomicrobiales bacterium]|nr:decaprenyl-phosphate phosphoribosyltransferase [Thermomicrobiales bacterium]
MTPNVETVHGRVAPSTASPSRRAVVTSALRALRPKQWTKNALVFAALVFDHQLFDPSRLATVVGAFACFCIASSAVYLINDIHDIESDRQHHRKRLRPIAAGHISPTSAWSMAVLLSVTALVGAILLRPAFAGIVAAYLLLMVVYTYVLKDLVIVDVFTISAGFLLRAAGGAVVLSVPISPWLYVCTILLSLFIGFAKRRHELQLLEESAGAHRRNLNDYSSNLLDQFILIAAAATVMAYALYTFTSPSLPDSHAMMVTIPFVLYAMFRYLFLVHRRDEGGSPEQMLLSDLPLLTCIILWGVVTIVILYAS